MRERIQKLRELSGMGIVECKNALTASNGDVDAAIIYLRKRGLMHVNRELKMGKNGKVFSYVHHTGKLGVLLVLTCETDFAANTEEFMTLGQQICLHIAAAHPLYIQAKDIPEDVMNIEREVYVKQMPEGKPQQIVEKILEGKYAAFYKKVCLMNQQYVRDDSLTIEQLIAGVQAQLKEQIVIKQFSRYIV